MFDFIYKILGIEAPSEHSIMKKNEDNNINNETHNNENEPRLVVSSVDELKKMQDEVKKDNKEDIEKLLNDSNYELQTNYDWNKKYLLPNIDLIDNESMKEYLDIIINNKNLFITLGKNDSEIVYYDMDILSNILICGTVSSGKTTLINDIIISILLRYRPNEVKLVMIDPKKVELSNYNGVPHLLMPVVTDLKKASVVLQKIVNEMENRYDEFSRKGVKNIGGYNEWVENENKFRKDNDKIAKMPYIVITYDSFVPYNAETIDSIYRITDGGNKAGIYLILSSNTCTKDIIPNEIKINFPTRVCFKVPSKRDSISVLDKEGANELTGLGNFLYVSKMNSKPKLLTTFNIEEHEIQSIIDYTVKQQIAQYDDKWSNLEAAQDQGNAGHHVGDSSEVDDDDDLYNDVVEFVITSGKASASLLQRRFKIGYNRAVRLVDLLEERGIIGPQNGSKPREVLVKVNDNDNELL